VCRRPRRHTVHPRPRRIGTLGAPTPSSAHGSLPPAGDRLHRVLPDGRTHLLISASGDKCAAPESLQFGFLCSPHKGWIKKPDQPLHSLVRGYVPSSTREGVRPPQPAMFPALVSPAWPGVDSIDRVDSAPIALPVPALVSPAWPGVDSIDRVDSAPIALPVPALVSPAWPGVDSIDRVDSAPIALPVPALVSPAGGGGREAAGGGFPPFLFYAFFFSGFCPKGNQAKI
jgi:hypothetical protein